MSDASDAAGLRAALEREAGDVDLLVNNAGVARNAPILDASAEDWDATFAVNARAALVAAFRAAARRDSTVGGVLDLTLVTRDGGVGERVALLGDDLAAAAPS